MTPGPERIRLQDGERLMGEVCPNWDKSERRAALISTLWSGTVPIRARVAVKPGFAHSPELPALERSGALNIAGLMPSIEGFLRAADSRTINIDIPTGRIRISGFIATDDDGRWAEFFPGWLTTAAGKFIRIEFEDVDFEAAPARAYVIENLLPPGTGRGDAQLNDLSAPSKEHADRGPRKPIHGQAGAKRKGGRPETYKGAKQTVFVCLDAYKAAHGLAWLDDKGPGNIRGLLRDAIREPLPQRTTLDAWIKNWRAQQSDSPSADPECR